MKYNQEKEIQYLKNNPEFLQKTIIACEELLDAYNNIKGLVNCPLCVLISNENAPGTSNCESCVWIAMTGDECNSDIAYVRADPQEHLTESIERLNELQEWIKTLKSWIKE